MAEHSMCHPGLPLPNGASHDAPSPSSPGCDLFQSAKSLTDSFSYLSVATLAPALSPARSRCDSSPYLGKQSHLDRAGRSEEHTSELQSRLDLVCRLLLEKKKQRNQQ